MHDLTIELQGLRLQRGGRRVLHDIDWRLSPGERWVLIGGNGAGKTQLLKLLAGSVWPDPSPSARPSRRYCWRGHWHSDTVEIQEEIAYLGPERQDRYARYEWNFPVLDVIGTGIDRVDIPGRELSKSMRARALKILRTLGCDHLANARMLEISSGERRLVLLARALATRPAWVLLDETLTHLDAANRQRLHAWLNDRRPQSPSWILSTHRREDIPDSATHALVLRNGRVLARGSMRSRAVRAAVSSVLGRIPTTRRGRPTSSPQLAAAVTAPRARRAPNVLLRVSHAALWIEGRMIARDIDFCLRRGECWIVSGANGSGKTSLLRALYGDYPFALGSQVRRIGVEPGEALQRFRLRCGFVAPQLQTDYPRQLTVRETVLSGWEASYGLNEAPPRAAQVAARRALEFWGLTRWSKRRLAELSYGQVRRVLFARAWLRRPDVLLLDEPFAGLDRAQRRNLAQRIERALVTGVGIVVASHHADEWPAKVTGEWRLLGQRLHRVR